jgi:large subunit ribosomal protein L21
MEAYAVIETGGKQYRVLAGSVLDIELLDAEAGNEVKLDRVLAVSDGATLTIGTPLVEGAVVTAEVLDHFRGDKVISFKKKRRKGYKKKIGHRQNLTKVRVVSVGGEAPAKKSTKTETAEV